MPVNAPVRGQQHRYSTSVTVDDMAMAINDRRCALTAQKGARAHFVPSSVSRLMRARASPNFANGLDYAPLSAAWASSRLKRRRRTPSFESHKPQTHRLFCHPLTLYLHINLTLKK